MTTTTYSDPPPPSDNEVLVLFALLFTLVAASFLVQGCSVWQGFTGALTGKYPCDTHSPSVPAVSEARLRAAWQASVGPLPSPACDAHWLWSVVSETDLGYICGLQANACTVYGNGPNGSDKPGCPMSYTYTKYAASAELNTHEFAHWALRCSRGDDDPTHSHFPDVWAKFDGSFGP